MPLRSVAALVLGLALVAPATPAVAQTLDVDRQRGLKMLTLIRQDLGEDYWDPGFGGVDVDALVARARQRIGAAQSLGEILGLIAGVCLDLRDSHTRFIPPPRVQEVDYGWSWRYVGDRALVDWIDDGSDAKAKGLRVGDAVIEVAGYPLTRGNHDTISYLLRQLRPQPQLIVTVERDGARRTLTLTSKFRKQRKRLDLDNELDLYVIQMRQAFAEAAAIKPKQEWLAPGVLYWRLPDFDPDIFTFGSQVDRLEDARRVVLDLRGNPGGKLAALSLVAGLFAPPGTLIATEKMRGKAVALETVRKTPVFTGPIAVLVDSRSASCAEMLAYFLQRRGAKVYGDTTGGFVRASVTRPHAVGDADVKVLFALQVTVSNLEMADGMPLEGRGVRPDVLSLPAADDLEHGLDPVLSQAAASFGVTIDPQKAARFSRP
jgi:C-terminal processing protease CtpA/Prc